MMNSPEEKFQHEKLQEGLFDLKIFLGYPPPSSNTTYTPNQFFDVVVPNSSRGAVRLVAYILRKTLGWCDADGNPQETEILTSYNDLIKNAGIGRGRIREALDEAIEKKFIHCVRQPNRSAAQIQAMTGLYELCWDESGYYATSLDKFNGFYAGEGYRTYIPNVFFDHTVRTEPLAVIKVVSAIVRYTIGFQTKHGFRRQQIKMSFNQLHRRTNIVSPRSLTQAIQTALSHNHILRVQSGFFDPNAGKLSQATVYALRWSDSDLFELLKQDQSQKDSGTSPKRIAENSRPNQSQKDSGTSPKRIANNQSQKDSDIEIKHRNKTSKIKQQQSGTSPNAVVVDLLKFFGINFKTAQRLAQTHSEQRITEVANWLKRKEAKNPAGLFIKALEEHWETPQEEKTSLPEKDLMRGRDLVAHYYAGYNGNKGQPTAIPSSNEITVGCHFIEMLLALWPDETKISQWGRDFGEHVRKQQTYAKNTVQFAVAQRLFGDAFITQIDSRRKQAQQQAVAQASENHAEKFEPQYLDYIKSLEKQIKKNKPDDYADFLADRGEKRDEIATGRFMINREQGLKDFDTEKRRLEQFQEFFPEEVLDFWDWDEKVNSEPFDEEAVKV